MGDIDHMNRQFFYLHPRCALPSDPFLLIPGVESDFSNGFLTLRLPEVPHHF